MTAFMDAGMPVAIVQGEHRGRWGYVDSCDGERVVVVFAHLTADENVTVRASEVARITFLAN